MWTVILKWGKKILNSKLLLYAIIAGVVYLWMVDRKNLADNVDRLSRNQDAILLRQSEQVELTQREFKRLYYKEDSIAQLVGIKPKQLQQVIVNNYHYKDTSIVQFPTIKSGDTIKFVKPIGCLKVEGYVLRDSISFTKPEFNDKLHTFLYGKRPHKFLFIKWGKWIIDAKTYSECKNDTIQVEKNLKIN